MRDVYTTMSPISVGASRRPGLNTMKNVAKIQGAPLLHKSP